MAAESSYAYRVEEHNGSRRLCSKQERDRLIKQGRVWDWKRVRIPIAWRAA